MAEGEPPVERSVKWALRNRITVLAITIVLLLFSGFGLYKVGTEFLPATDEGSFSVAVKLPNGSSTAATNEVVRKIEAELKEHDDVEVDVSLVGGTQESLAQGSSNANRAEVYVKLIPLDGRDRSVFEFVDEVQPIVLKEVGEDAKISFNMQTASGSSPNTLSFALNDINEKRLGEAVTKLNDELSNIDAVTEVTNTLADTVEEIQMPVDREKAIDKGLVPYQLAQTVNNITRGALATQIISEDNEVFSVLVEYDEKYRDSIDNYGN